MALSAFDELIFFFDDGLVVDDFKLLVCSDPRLHFLLAFVLHLGECLQFIL